MCCLVLMRGVGGSLGRSREADPPHVISPPRVHPILYYTILYFPILYYTILYYDIMH